MNTHNFNVSLYHGLDLSECRWRIPWREIPAHPDCTRRLVTQPRFAKQFKNKHQVSLLTGGFKF